MEQVARDVKMVRPLSWVGLVFGILLALGPELTHRAGELSEGGLANYLTFAGVSLQHIGAVGIAWLTGSPLGKFRKENVR